VTQLGVRTLSPLCFISCWGNWGKMWYKVR